MDKILELIGINKTFAGRPVVKNVNISVLDGEIFGLVGESGSGKTTLARIILGLIERDSGRIFYKGREISSLLGNKLRHALMDMQIVFQDPLAGLNPKMKVASAVKEPLIIRKIPKKEIMPKVMALLSDVGLLPSFADRYPSELSGGEAQRVCIARSLAADPKLLVLDEPVSSLDFELQEEIIELLLLLKKQKELTYIFITHDLMLAERLCSRVGVMKDGEIIETGSAQDIFKNPQCQYTKQLLEDAI
ncbi:MAG: ABC transporter ATP-binding protein [Candidatus Margulisiibacteriota bacterium]